MKKPIKKTEKKETSETEPSSWGRFKAAIHKIVPPKKAKAHSTNRGTKNSQ